MLLTRQQPWKERLKAARWLLPNCTRKSFVGWIEPLCANGVFKDPSSVTNNGARAEKQVKERCQKGIPPSLRGRAWLYLTGGKVKREQNAGKYQVSRRTDSEVPLKRAHGRLEKAQMWLLSSRNSAVFLGAAESAGRSNLGGHY